MPLKQGFLLQIYVITSYSIHYTKLYDPASKAPIIPISAQSGLNIDALISSIESTIKTPDRDDSKDAIMHVLRSFDVNKPGTKSYNFV